MINIPKVVKFYADEITSTLLTLTVVILRLQFNTPVLIPPLERPQRKRETKAAHAMPLDRRKGHGKVISCRPAVETPAFSERNDLELMHLHLHILWRLSQKRQRARGAAAYCWPTAASRWHKQCNHISSTAAEVIWLIRAKNQEAIYHGANYWNNKTALSFAFLGVRLNI